MSEPAPPATSDPPAPDPKSKDKGKGLDKFIVPPVTPKEPKAPITPPAVDPPTDDIDYKEEMEKLQKKQYNTERKIALQALEGINPEVAEKYKSKKLSDIETALDVAKVSSPKFPVNREAPVAESSPRQGFKDPRDGKWK